MIMSRTLTDVLVERERLLARGAQQRVAVASAVHGLSGSVAILDRVAAGGRFLARHPLGVAGGMGLVIALRGRSMLKLALRGISLFRLALRARTFMQLVRR